MSPTATAEPMPDYKIPDAQAALEERYERLPLEWVAPSKTNPRTHFDDGYLAELANSILDKGVIQPILVRPLSRGMAKDGTRYEIVAGECRFRASRLAQRTHIPAVIREYTDEQVLELQLVENIHRQDLTALEQAAGYRALIKSNPDKHSAATIAQRIGMSEAWVWDRLKLNDLIPEAKTILERELMTVGHAILIARLKPADQTRVIAIGNGRNGYDGQREGLWQHHGGRLDLDDEKKAGKYDDVKAVSVRELESWIKRHIRFDVQHAAKAQPLAFEETLTRVSEAEAKEGRGKKVIPITHEYRVADDARDGSERTYGSESWKRADGQEKSKTCEYSVLGVVVAGRGQGDTLQVCVNRDKCLVHFGAVIRLREKSQKLRESGKGKQAAKAEKKQEDTWQKRQEEQRRAEAQWQKLQPHALAAVAAKIKPAALTDAILRGTIDYMDVNVAQLEKLLGARVTKKNFARAVKLVDVLNSDYSAERFRPIAKKYGVDLAKLEKELQAGVKAAAGNTR